MIGAEVKRLVIKRATGRCEYCHIEQKWFDFSFHIEHIVATQHRGDDSSENLALSCNKCNSFKGPNLSAFDPETWEKVDLFHPRIDEWDEHFAIIGFEVIGVSKIGRATVRLLNMNSEKRLELRRLLLELGKL